MFDNVSHKRSFVKYLANKSIKLSLHIGSLKPQVYGLSVNYISCCSYFLEFRYNSNQSICNSVEGTVVCELT